MEYEIYATLKNELESYFAKIIKDRFKQHVSENFELTISADYETHRLIENLLDKDGLDVFGMNVNMDGFQLLLDFKHEYQQIENFPFTRISVDLTNNGNYNVYLSEDSFEDDWTIFLEDEYQRFRNLSKEAFEKIIDETKQVHVMMLLKQ